MPQKPVNIWDFLSLDHEPNLVNLWWEKREETEWFNVISWGNL
jgi:hypothetical protein